MTNNSFFGKLSNIAKWLVYALCALLGLKVLISVVSFVSTTLAIATLGAWLLGLAAVGGLGLFFGLKFLKKK